MEEFLVFVAGVFGIKRECLSENTRYGELPQWDSMMHLRLIMEVDDKFGADIALDEIPKIKTLGQLFAFTQLK